MAWNLLLTSDIGLLSLFTILFIIAMAIYIGFYVAKQVNKEEHNPGTELRPNGH